MAGYAAPLPGVFYDRRYDPTKREDVKQDQVTDESRSDARAYGGSLKAFDDAKRRLGAKADDAMGRQGYGYDLNQYNEARGLAGVDRQQQMRGLDMLRDQMTARRTAGSEAIQQGAERAAARQSSLATLAQGGMLGEVAANRQANAGNLLAGQVAGGQMQALRAQEAQQAALQYGQAAGQIRSLDAATQAQAGTAAEAQAANRMRTDEQNAARQRDAEALRASVLGAQQGQVIREDQQDLRRYGVELALQAGDAARADRYAGAGMAAGASALGYGAGAAKDLLSDSATGQQGTGGDGGRKRRDDEVLYSDERAKKNVKPLSDAEAAKLSAEADRLFPGKSTVRMPTQEMGPGRKEFRDSMSGAPFTDAEARGYARKEFRDSMSGAPADGDPIYMPVQEMSDSEPIRIPVQEMRGAYVPPGAHERMRRDADATAEDLHRALSQPDETRAARERDTTLPREMMRSLDGGYAYNYREGSGEDPTRRRYGVMAQDLERTPMGASLVEDTPRGKVIDTRQAAGTLLASVSDLQRQIDEMKKRRR